MSGQELSQFTDEGGRTWVRISCECDGADPDCLSCDHSEPGVRTALACDECGACDGYCQCNEPELEAEC